MIKPAEIQKQARNIGVRDTQIEKDYILTWILKGISQHPALSKILVFKGGTVLKKVYFEDYRYSEDLDFTLLDDKAMNEDIFRAFTEAFDWIKEEANIQFSIGKDNEHESGSINFYINYAGPLGGSIGGKNVKVDITRGEILEFGPILRNAFIHYSDVEDFILLCYPLEEVLIEKMCALMGRSQARDLYDLWYLLEYNKMNIGYFMPEFERKSRNEGHNPNDFKGKLASKMASFKNRWEGSLSAQIKDLPDFSLVERELTKHLRKI